MIPRDPGSRLGGGGGVIRKKREEVEPECGCW